MAGSRCATASPRSRVWVRARWSCWSTSATRAGASSRSTISRAASIRGCSTSARSRRWRGAGAFDGIEPDRAGVFAAAETILAVAQRTSDSRTSGQGGLFGEAEPGGGAIQLPTSVHWSLANRINAEREAFGFYFSAHPLDRFVHLARVHGARAIASLGEISGGRERARRRDRRRAGRGCALGAPRRAATAI